MFSKIAKFEYRFQARNPVFWVATGVLFLLTFGAMTSENIQIGSGGNVHANSPAALASTHLTFTLFFMFVTTAFVANIVVRDDETGFGSIVRSTRITKFQYLIGRFSGAFPAAAVAFLAVPLAIWVGTLMPWLDPETLGPNRLSYYAYSYFVLALPNIFLTSAIFFALATITRSMMATYVGVVAFLILYLVTLGIIGAKPEFRETLAIIEPFGIAALGDATRYWTPAESNILLPALEGPLLINRLLWIGIGIGFLALAYKSYSFTTKPGGRRKRRKLKLQESAVAENAFAQSLSSQQIAPRFDGATARAQFWSRTQLELKQVFKSPAFGVLLALGLLNVMGVLAIGGGNLFGAPTIPVTRAVIPALEGAYTFFTVIIAIYYAGELVWRERDRKFHEIVDATPLPNWGYVVPKTIAVALVLFAAMIVGVLGAMIIQLFKGVSDLELGKYFLWYILPSTVDITLLAVLAVFIQALSPNKYIGWGLMVLFLIFQTVSGSMGFEHNLYRYSGSPTVAYSDMNEAGRYWVGAWWFRLYWAAFAVLLLVAAHLLWRRGTETKLKPRLRRAPARLRGLPGLIGGLALATFVGTGAWAYYNTNVLNEYRTSDDSEEYLAEYEKKFLRYENVPQPSVSHSTLEVSLYPEQGRAITKGNYILKNVGTVPVTEIHVRDFDEEMEITSLSVEAASRAMYDEDYGYSIYRLNTPMAPGDVRKMSFVTKREQKGFRNSGADTNLVQNGTFLNNLALAPTIGMSRQGLLPDRTKRRKYGLAPELRTAKLEDLSATKRSYFVSGWTTADITVSTSADQTPIAPGKKISDVTSGGRRTARFVSDAPILPFFSIQSARYAEKHRLHAGVDLAVYYHPAHGLNVDRMLNALATGLDYYQANFGPYQFDQARIIEFPAYATFAQAFANTMPYSEAIGFVLDASDPEGIDAVTYVTAHELGHQYWAHQVIGADMQGSTSLSETLAQYSALMVMKKLYGEDTMRRFLKLELDNYLRGRGSEIIEEVPLARVENQQYIHYNKGSLVMYLLQHRLGEDAVNRALRSVIAKYKFKGAPYPRSVDLIQALRAQAKTPEHQALITDLFEKITVYDLKTEAPTAVKRADGKWDVTVPVTARKFYAGGKGEERETALSENIEVGLFTAEPGVGRFDRKNVIALSPQRLKSGRQVLRFVAAKKPTHVGVDPYNFYIDRDSSDNVVTVS